MNSRERFEACMKHRQPDRPPFDIGATCLTSMRRQKDLAEFLGLPGEPHPVGAWGFDERIMEWAEVDFRGVGRIIQLPSVHAKDISETCKVNCWGVRKELIDNEWQITGNPLRGADEDDLENFKWPDPHIDECLLEAWVAEAKRLSEQGKYVVLAEHPVLGIMELGCMMFGYEDYLCNIAAEPDMIRRFNDKVLEIQLEVIRQYYSALGPYIDLTISGDDFGTQQAPLISPETFGEMVAPWFTERIRQTKATAGCYYWHHSCGSIFDLLDQIIGCGVDIINPVQTSAAKMDPCSLKRTFGERAVFWGAMDVQQFLPFAAPEEVHAKTQELISVLGKNGGYVMAPAHEMNTDIPLENIAAWVDAVKASGQN
jgi:uroporphyrinogen decarboxylase